MKAVFCGVLLTVVISGCDRSATPPLQNDVVARLPNNGAASQSIMQPKVIAEAEPTPARPPAPPPPITGISILFSTGTTLDDFGRRRLDELLAAPNLPSNATWVLRGNSDSIGSDSANLTSSRQRAISVRDYLIERGIDAARISVISLGERRPIAPNAALDGSDDPVGRARNRRVDIELVQPTSSEPSPIPNTAQPAASQPPAL